MIPFYVIELMLCLGAVVLSLFCFSLTRKLRKLNDLEHGIGGAIAVLIGEIARLDRSISTARHEALKATAELSQEIERAKQERAYWVLQQKFSPTRDGKNLSIRRRRVKGQENQDA